MDTQAPRCELGAPREVSGDGPCHSLKGANPWISTDQQVLPLCRQRPHWMAKRKQGKKNKTRIPSPCIPLPSAGQVQQPGGRQTPPLRLRASGSLAVSPPPRGLPFCPVGSPGAWKAGFLGPVLLSEASARSHLNPSFLGIKLDQRTGIAGKLAGEWVAAGH